MEGTIGKYILQNRLGNGSFGEVYSAITDQYSKIYAVKISGSSIGHSQLLTEESILRSLHEHGDGMKKNGFPVQYGCQRFRNGISILAMDKLGSSLEDLFNACGRRFSLKTVLMIADQILCRLEVLHSINIIHRDIKPANFLIGEPGAPDEDVIHMIDFGLSRSCVRMEGGEVKHIQMTEDNELVGTARYVSANTHKGYMQSRRDDLESLGYMLMYFNRGSLPWQGMAKRGMADDSSKSKYEDIGKKKMATPLFLLCRGFPSEFQTFLEQCRSMEFSAIPDYAQLRLLFSDLFVREGFIYDGDFDWKIAKRKESLIRQMQSEASKNNRKQRI